MATQAPVTVGTDWTLIYDTAVSGDFCGAVTLCSGINAVISVQSSAPIAGAGGVPISGGESLPVGMKVSNSEKLYGRALYGNAVLVMG